MRKSSTQNTMQAAIDGIADRGVQFLPPAAHAAGRSGASNLVCGLAWRQLSRSPGARHTMCEAVLPQTKATA